MQICRQNLFLHLYLHLYLCVCLYCVPAFVHSFVL